MIEQDVLHEAQIGFLPGNRNSDHIFTLRTLIDKVKQVSRGKLYTCFIDFRKAFDQEKMRDREGDAQSSPWDILISVKLFLDGTKTEVCFPRGPQSQQARVVAILNIHQQPLHNAISTSSDEFI